jgi:hypothetical protein
MPRHAERRFSDCARANRTSRENRRDFRELTDEPISLFVSFV